jgi:formamidopyrimidine-DNA glycosylase
MIELPESYVLSDQINESLKGKVVKNININTHPHSYAWYSGDTKYYQDRLVGKTITNSNPGTGIPAEGIRK